MKIFLTSLFFIILSTNIAQEMTWGEEFQNQRIPGIRDNKIEKIDGVLNILGERDNKVYSVDWDGKYLYVFNALSQEMISMNKIVIEKELKCQNCHKIISIIFLNNKLILFARFYDKIQKVDKIMAHEINDEGVAVKSTLLSDYMEKIASNSKTPSKMQHDIHGNFVYNDNVKNNTDSYHFQISPDSTKVLVGYSYFDKKIDSYEALVATYNSDLTPLTKKMVVKTKYSSKTYLNQCSYIFGISNEGEWASSSRVMNKGVDATIPKLTQCLEFKGFDKLGKLKNSSHLFLDNLSLVVPQFILALTDNSESFMVVGDSYENSKRRIKLENEFMGVYATTEPSGMFTCQIFKPSLSKSDINQINFSEISKDDNNRINFTSDPLIYDNGFVIPVKTLGLVNYQYVLYFDEIGNLSNKYEFLIQGSDGNHCAMKYGMMGIPRAGMYCPICTNIELNTHWRDASIKLINRAGQIEYIVYDILEREINSLEKFEINKSNFKNIDVALVRVTVAENGIKTRTVLDDSKIEFLIFPGINYRMNNGTIFMLSILEDKGKLVTITP
ncbi:MAG: hypothetical protein ACI93P_002653 [bacterium]|jgi:hypothetical protein